MKAPATLIWFLCVSLPLLQPSAAVTGDSLNIGDNNDVTSHSTYGSAIGSYNAVNSSGYSYLLVGSGNQMFYATASIVAGWSNEGAADTSIAIGWANNVWSMYSLVGGEMNTAGVYDGIVFGSNNSLSGGLQFAFGQGLINNDDPLNPTLYTGQYNKDITALNPVFVIGNGSGPAANQRSNALEVYIDGKTKMNNALEVKAPNYNPANVNSGRIVLQPSTGGSSVTVDGRPLLMANSSGYVGIGLSNPSHLLDIGSSYFDSDGSASFANGNVIIDPSGMVFSGSGFNSGALSLLDVISGFALVSASDGGSSVNYSSRELCDAVSSAPVMSWGHGDGSVTFTGKIGVGTETPSSMLTVVAGESTPTSTIGKTMIDWEYEQGGDATVYYTKIADIGSNNGALHIEGLLGGHTASQGKSVASLLISEREVPIRVGSVIGNMGNSDVKVYKNANGTSSVYLVTAEWAEVNLRVTGVSGAVTLFQSPGATNVAPGGTLAYSLKQNAQFNLGGDGTLKLAKRQGDVGMGRFTSVTADQ